MTDRELLETVATLIGEWPSPEPFEHVLRRWNPLTDDGDALRLAVKLNLDIRYKDSYAATRRAIVRAAAAIGKERT